MKVKVKIDCIGIGYDLKAGEIAQLPINIAQKLIKVGFVEEVKTRKPKEVKE